MVDRMEGCTNCPPTRTSQAPREKHHKHKKSKESQISKLFVSKIPANMTSDELSAVFTQVASPLNVFISTHKSSKYTWGFVEYVSDSDAEAAIKILNQAPPYHLGIKYAIASSGESKGDSNHKSTSHARRSMDNHISRCSQKSSLGPRQKEETSSSETNGELREKHPLNRSNNTNRSRTDINSLSNIRVNVSENGFRTANAVFESSEELGDLEDLDDTSSLVNFTTGLVALDNCRVCKSDASLKCPYCNTPYCSQVCAAKDWKHHKLHCKQNMGAAATSTPRDVIRNGDQRSQSKRKFGNHHNSSKALNRSRNSENNDERTKSHTKKYSNNHSGENSSVNAKKGLPSCQESKSNQESSPELLTSGIYTQVSVTQVGDDGSYWVVKTSDLDTALSIYSQLQEHCSGRNIEKIEKATLDLYCAAFFIEGNEWSRAVVTAIQPGLKVRYIDYGNEDIISVDNLRTLPPELSSIKPLAFKIKFLQDSSSLVEKIEMDSKISIKPVKFEGSTQIVKIDSLSEGVLSPEPFLADSDTTPFSLNALQEVIISYVVEKSVYWVQKATDCILAEQLLVKLFEVGKSPIDIAASDLSIGSMCAVLFQDLWYRAEVLTIKPSVKVRLTDYGNEATCLPNEIKKLPKDLADLPHYAIKIRLTPDTNEKYCRLQIEDKLSVKLISKMDDAWLVHVENGACSSDPESNYKSTPELSSNQPCRQQVTSTPKENTCSSTTKDEMEATKASAFKVDNISSTTATLPIPMYTFSKVTITYSTDIFTYWVHKTSDVQATIDLVREVNEVCENTPNIRLSELNVGTICAAFDELWYRAEIIALKPAIKVFFIDYGSEQLCSISQIKSLPQHLTIIPPYAFKICLAPGTPEKYTDLCEEDQLVVKPVSKVKDSWLVHVENVSYGATPLKALPVSTNTVESFLKGMVSTSNVTLNSSQCSTETGSDSTPVSPFSMTSFTQVVITYPVDKSIYWVQKSIDTTATVDLIRQINKLCETSTLLKTSDLILGHIYAALFQDLWFRAELLALKPAIKVRFIDYGNEEICMLSDVRSLPQEIAAVPPYAFKIQLAPGSPDKYTGLSDEETLSVKPVSLVDDYWLVQIENEFYDPAIVSCHMATNALTEAAPVEPEIQPFVETIRKQEPPVPRDSFTNVIVSYPDEPGVYWVYKKSNLSQIDKILHDLKSHCSGSQCRLISTPTVGLLVSALFDEDWYRAQVISTKPELKVKFIDFGNDAVCSPESVKDIPLELSSLPPLAFRVKLAEGTSGEHMQLPEGENLSICPISQCDDGWVVHVENKTAPTGTVTFSGNVPEIQPKHIKEELPPIPTNIFTNVCVMHPEGADTYWVCKMSDLETAQQVLSDLDEFCNGPHAKPVSHLTTNTLCSALYEGEWNRARVVAVQPVLLVHFIDFGSEEILTLDQIRSLPSNLSSIPPLAFKIRLAADTSSKYLNLGYLDKLSIKLISPMDNENWLVHVENDACLRVEHMNSQDEEGEALQGVAPPTENPHHSQNKFPSDKEVPLLVDQLVKTKPKLQEPPIPKELFSEVSITYPVNYCSYWVISTDKLQAAEDMFEHLNFYCRGSSVQRITDIKSGMKCAAKFSSEWNRARVVNVAPLQVKLVDYGSIEEVSISDIKQLPPGLGQIKPLAFMIKLSEQAADKYKGLMASDTLLVKPHSRDIDGSWLVSTPEEERTSDTHTDNTLFVKEKKISFRIKSESDDSLSSRSNFDAVLKSENDISNDNEVKSFCLSMNNFSEVIISFKNSIGDFWVNIGSSLNSLMDMSENLGNLEKENVIPVVGKIYVHYYIDIWCRAQVITLKPLTIFYIDYGNEEVISECNLHPLPAEYCSTPPFAFRIRLAEGTSKQFQNMEISSVLHVKPVDKSPQGVYTVQVKGEKYNVRIPSPVQEADVDNEPVNHLLDVAVKHNQCDLIVNKVLSSQNISCTVLLGGYYANHKEQITNKIRQLSLAPHFSCKVGSMVACKDKDGTVGRGHLLSDRGAKTPAKVSLIDYGYCCEPVAIGPLPFILEQLPPASVTCKFKQAQSYIKTGVILKCHNLLVKDDRVLCEVFQRGMCTLSPWKPDIIPVIPSVPLTSGTSVTVSAVTEFCNIVYIQPLTRENIASLRTIIVQTNSSCAYAPSLATQPVEGDIIGCAFSEDKIYYRAQVTEIKNNTFGVVFLDFGNTADVSLSDMKPLPEELKAVATCSVKVVLEGVDNSPMLPEVKSLVDNHIDDKTSFNLVYTTLSEVRLETRGQCLNSQINNIVRPSNKRLVRRLMVDRLRYVDWSVGVRLDVIIVSKLPYNNFLVLHDKDPHLNKIQDKLTKCFTDYAKTFPSDYSYKPLIDELVIACFEDGLWYRARCLKEVKGFYEMFFLDFGNTAVISNEHIRPMEEEHLSTPVVIRKCRINGVPEEVSTEVQKELDSLFQIGTIHEVIVIDKSDSLVSLHHPVLKAKVLQNLIQLPKMSLPKVL